MPARHRWLVDDDVVARSAPDRELGGRGFQFSFDRRLRELSLGSLMQRAQIAALCDEGIETYDLGMDVRYKRRWADRARDTLTLAILL